MPIPCVLSDLDSTVSGTKHREHLASPTPHDTQSWIEYSKACVDDEPIWGTIRALQILSKVHLIYLVSGRNVEAEDETRLWLKKYEVPCDGLRLHSEFDLRTNAEYKVEHIRVLRSLGYNPVLMFEDSPVVADAVEAVGVPVVRVLPSYEDMVGVSFNGIVPPAPGDD